MNRVRFRLAASACIAAAVTLLAWAGLSAGVFFGTQLRLSDALFPSGGADHRIVIVGIDDKSLAQQGRWPWDRRVHARLIRRLDAGGAALIGYDVTFSEPSRDHAADRALAAAIGRRRNVILAADALFAHHKAGNLLQAQHVETPIPEFTRPAAAEAHPNVFPDSDGVVRSLPPVVQTPSGDFLPSLSFALMQLASGQAHQPITVRPDGIQAGSSFVPTGPAHLMDVNFAQGFKTYSATDVIAGRVPPGVFRHKIVLVGATAVGLGDLPRTPLDKAGQPGVLVHANALNTMLTGGYLFPEGRGVTLIEVFLMALLVALAVAFLRIWISPAILAGLLVGFFMIAFRRFDRGQVMNLVYPPLAAAVAFVSALVVHYLTETRERRRVTAVFGRYVAPDVVQEILESPRGAVAELSGASRPLAVLFSDLRGFTAASEDAAPEDVVEALNVYLDAMVRAVHEERGTIDKFMGDCVMAFWGAPRPDPDYAEHAVRAGLKMLGYIDEAVKGGPAAKLRVKGCGVGISAGRAVVGNIGSSDRLDFTAIGDTVNTSSRLCGVAGAGELVVTEECANLIGDGFNLSELPPLVVKGKSQPLRVFQVLRPGQIPKVVLPGDVISAVEEKGHFEPAGYAPAAPPPPVPAAAPEGE